MTDSGLSRVSPVPQSAREIIQYTDPLLRTQCQPITDGYPLRELFIELERAMAFPRGIGIAAPQIGEPVRVIFVKVPHGRSIVRYCIANPEVYWIDRAQRTGWEGCLSFPQGFRALVPRSRHIKLKCIDANGEPIQFGGKDSIARVLQHEIDHLDGKLMIDQASRVDDGERRRRKKEGIGI